MMSAQAIAQQALARAAAGDDAGAAALFAQGLDEFPDDARLANSAGNFHNRAGRPTEAFALFERAMALAPDLFEAALNAAIVATGLGQPARAITILNGYAKHPAVDARYWRVRTDAEREVQLYREASSSLAKAAALEPNNPKTARIRARLSLERNDPAVLADHEQALALFPGDPNLMHDYAQALALAGRMEEALEYTGALAEYLPAWPPGLILHAELRWAKGETDRFADHFARAATAEAATPQVMLAWSSLLDGIDRHSDSAAVLAQACARWPDRPELVLAHAVALGEAGDADAAQAILTRHSDLQDRDWNVARGRNLLRLGETPTAERTLAGVLQDHPSDVQAWALIDLCWRMMDDPRHQWLHGQDNLVRKISLPLDPAELSALTALLDDLHRSSAPPIGQSVKIGTQTKGALFARYEPELARLEAALHEVLADYRAGLPTFDARHPLLSRRADPWRIIGSWSIRLEGAGHHAAHIHPRGTLSSASYYRVSPEVDTPGRGGWLELGRPPTGLVPGLSALHEVKPEVGTCVLFPSTLFHGTRPISTGTRMTVAFDVAAETSS
jgi:predicted Zn-dependent protease